MKSARLMLLSLLLSGCATVTRVEPPAGVRCVDGAETIETVEISNTCWQFLTFLPIASGDPEAPNSCSCRWFADTCVLDSQLKMLEAEVKRAGASKAVDVVTRVSDEPWFFILFLREKYHTSATLIK